MPVGLFILIGFSVLVFRRSRLAGRRPWLWILALWASTLLVGAIASIGVAFAVLLESGGDATDQEVQDAVLLPTALGMFLGAGLAIWACGRTLAKRSIDDRDADND